MPLPLFIFCIFRCFDILKNLLARDRLPLPRARSWGQQRAGLGAHFICKPTFPHHPLYLPFTQELILPLPGIIPRLDTRKPGLPLQPGGRLHCSYSPVLSCFLCPACLSRGNPHKSSAPPLLFSPQPNLVLPHGALHSEVSPSLGKPK